MLVLWLTGASALAATEPESAPMGDVVLVGEALRELALPLTEEAQDALRQGEWEAAEVPLRAMVIPPSDKPATADWAFLIAWCAHRAGTPERAIDLLEWLEPGVGHAPEDFATLARGAVLEAASKPKEALQAYDAVGSESSLYADATLGAVRVLDALGESQAATERLKRLLDRQDPVTGGAAVLLAAAERVEGDEPAAHSLLRRIWTYYPASEEAVLAEPRLSNADAATVEQQVERAAQWMWEGEYDKAISETDGLVELMTKSDRLGCRLRYLRGRSHYKRNRLTAAATTLAGIGEQCEKVQGNFGPRGLYLLGTAEYRRKRFESSAATYEALHDLYLEHTMADDALTRGGISWLEAGKPDKAREWWERALKEHPEGDTVPEATLRLAFARYDQGDPQGAVATAEALAKLPINGNAVNVDAGDYWAARWRYYPDSNNPRTPSEDAAARKSAIERWEKLCRERPHSFYSILAYSRLLEVAPELAGELAKAAEAARSGWKPEPWPVRRSVLRHPQVRDGAALMRLGLVQEGVAAWRSADVEWTADEKAWTTELRIAAGDWLIAHDDLRRWIEEHPLTTLGPREAQIVRLAWPDRYWREVSASVADDYAYEPRLFHALVREESTFNREIISFAGAIGLSQLMWRTAQQTAGWLKIDVSREDLFEPEKNLKIGARYLHAMHRQLSDSPYLALAAYNGGARNVNRWVEANENPPVDEWVERIPFRETRGYVKRVMGTWQTMRYHFDAGAPYPDLSAYNQRAKP